LHLAAGVRVITRHPKLVLVVVKKPKPSETAVFSLKTQPKPTNLGQRETVTMLATTTYN